MKKEYEFMYGAAAPQLQPEYDRETSPAASESIQISKKIERTRHNAKNTSIKASMVISIIIAFSMCFMVIYRYVRLTELNYDLIKMTAELDEIKNDNSRLKVEIQENDSLDKIKAIAEKELGMHKPDNYQIINVAVPKSSYVVVSEARETPSDNFVTSITQKVGQLISMIR